jgi:hypothetical protein
MTITDVELEQLLALARNATPRPWYVRCLDDDMAMSLVAISTVRDTGRCERWPNFDPKEIVAATIVQSPRYVSIADDKWDENAAYIVAAASVLPALVEELLELRRRVREDQ